MSMQPELEGTTNMVATCPVDDIATTAAATVATPPHPSGLLAMVSEDDFFGEILDFMDSYDVETLAKEMEHNLSVPLIFDTPIQSEPESTTSLVAPFDDAASSSLFGTLPEVNIFDLLNFRDSYGVGTEDKELELDSGLCLDFTSFLEQEHIEQPMGDKEVPGKMDTHAEDVGQPLEDKEEAEKKETQKDAEDMGQLLGNNDGEKMEGDKENIDSSKANTPEGPIRLTAKRPPRKYPNPEPKRLTRSFGKEFVAPTLAEAEPCMASNTRVAKRKGNPKVNSGRGLTGKRYKCDIINCTKTYSTKKDQERHFRNHYFDLNPDSYYYY